MLACWLTVVAGDGYGHGHSSHGIGTACIVKVDTYLHISTHISTVQGSYCQCHYCKCEKGHIHCKGHGHGGGYGELE